MRSIQRWRWAAVFLQTALVAGLPFVKLRGDSALRFDIPTMRLLFFGTKLWMGEMYVVLLASLMFFILIIAFTLVLGRVWCGWACPQTVIGEYVGFMRDRLKPRRGDGPAAKAARLTAYHITLAVLSAFVSANLIWYFVSPYEMLPELFTWSIGPITKSFFVVMAVGFYAHFGFLGQRFCGTVCPYSKWQSVLLDKNSLIIAFDASRADECMGCDRCVTVCPTGMDIKAGLQVECINCAKCVDACREMTARKGRRQIVRYTFGSPEATIKDALTRKFWLFAAVAAALAGMLAYHAAAREMVALQVVKDRQELYVLAEDGYVVNSYQAYITNRGPRPASYVLELSGLDGAALAGAPGRIVVGPGARAAVPFSVRAKPGSGSGAERVTVAVIDTQTGESAVSEAGFIFP